jgi:LacI family transcriptional regulator
VRDLDTTTFDHPSDQGVRRDRVTRRATLKDVAQAAGVSQSTTSRALSGQGYVAPEVRDRVRASAEGLGYVPHAMARSLRSQVSRSVGVLVSDLRNSFYADLAAGVAGRARAHGYTMTLVDDQGSAEDELGAVQAFVAARAAGVVLTPVTAAASAYLLAQRVPVVEVDRQFFPDRCDAVVVDNRHIAGRVTEHLLALGHRRIALLIDETAWTTGAERSVGYLDALAAAGLPPAPELLVPVGGDVDDARRASVDLLAQRHRPTAVFAANNVLAEGLWRAVSDLGLRVPADVSIASFDDAPWMSMVSPGVTAVAQDVVALGASAVDRLLARIADPDQPPRTVVLEARILPRGSTAAPHPA